VEQHPAPRGLIVGVELDVLNQLRVTNDDGFEAKPAIDVDGFDTVRVGHRTDLDHLGCPALIERAAQARSGRGRDCPDGKETQHDWNAHGQYPGMG